jgi:hypothetical protein
MKCDILSRNGVCRDEACSVHCEDGFTAATIIYCRRGCGDGGKKEEKHAVIYIYVAGEPQFSGPPVMA